MKFSVVVGVLVLVLVVVAESFQLLLYHHTGTGSRSSKTKPLLRYGLASYIHPTNLIRFAMKPASKFTPAAADTYLRTYRQQAGFSSSPLSPANFPARRLHSPVNYCYRLYSKFHRGGQSTVWMHYPCSREQQVLQLEWRGVGGTGEE